MSNTPFFSQQHRRDIDRFWRCPKQMPIVIDLDLACDAQKKKNENKIVRLAPRVHCALCCVKTPQVKFNKQVAIYLVQ